MSLNWSASVVGVFYPKDNSNVNKKEVVIEKDTGVWGGVQGTSSCLELCALVGQSFLSPSLFANFFPRSFQNQFSLPPACLTFSRAGENKYVLFEKKHQQILLLLFILKLNTGSILPLSILFIFCISLYASVYAFSFDVKGSDLTIQ